ncbi:MAG: NUDIX domain-containing protein [Desulfuromonadales bacterium]
MNDRSRPIRQVVTAFLRHEGKILLLKRSDRVRTYRGRWAAVSGSLEEPTPLAQALREIREETGLGETDLCLVAAAPCQEVVDAELATRWLIHPFLFEVNGSPGVRLDWEHEECRWIEAAELSHYLTVPALAQVLAACLQTEAGSQGD